MEGVFMSKIIKTIHLTETDLSTLESILRQSTVEARTYIRAKILLLKYDGYTYEQIADKLDVCLFSVKSCVQRFLNCVHPNPWVMVEYGGGLFQQNDKTDAEWNTGIKQKRTC